MKHEDEYRPASAAIAATRARIAADLDGFIRDYDEQLYLKKLNEASAARLEKKLVDLQKQVGELRRDQKRKATELSRLKSENAKLLSTLTALRKSWRVRVGTSITAPLRWTRPASALLNAAGAAPGGAPNRNLVSESGAKEVPGTVGGDETGPVWEEMLDAVANSPTKANVLAAVSAGYYKFGKIAEPLELLREHSNLLTPLAQKDKQLLLALEGLAAVADKEFRLPPRQSNAAYQPERGRLLYCAHSVAPYNSNGYSTRTSGLVEGMSSAGVDVVVAARPGYPWDVKTDVLAETSQSFEASMNGISHFFSSGPNWKLDRLDHYLEKSVDSYVQVALRTRPATIQAASNHITALPALIAARRLGLPFVYEVRGLWEVTKASTSLQWADSEAFHLAKTLETFVATAADHVFAITDQVRTELVARGVQRENISVLGNAVNTKAFAPMPAHAATLEKLGIPQGTPVLGYAGSLVEYEGLESLLEASRILADQGLDFRTVIVGDGVSMPRLRDLTKRLGLDETVIFTGRVSAAEISNYISVFDILPCPRLRLPVTEMVSPLKPLEAMAAGKAVVLSDLPPLRDIAGGDGIRARLFRAGDSSELAKVLAELLGDSQQRREMGRRARLWTVGERNWTHLGAVAGELVRDERLRSGVQHLVPPSKELNQIKIGIIADPFTIAGLEPEAALVKLGPESWAQQLAESPIDVLFVESAWEGNDGSWQGKVGFYNDEAFSDLRELISFCRSKSIPTIFWNKEDPVHFNRFRVTAKHFDHVFTTDDNSIQAYLDNAGGYLKSVSSLPFYAQPVLHNPVVGSRPYNHTVAYAGSYYGDRYRDRSAQLRQLLAAAVPMGLAIYDRQHLNPASPYKFPPYLAPYVRGGLSYEETVDAYKSHPVHVNVNSVENSGTMFSRRVYEIAACGGALVSGSGHGIKKMFGGIIPVAEDQASASALIGYWMQDEGARKADAWLALRAVYRSHTAGHRLTYVLRTSGLNVKAPHLEPYAVTANSLTNTRLAELESQSVRPQIVIVSEPLDEDLQTELRVLVSDNPEKSVQELGLGLMGRIPQGPMDRTFFEDLLTSRKYNKWSEAGYSSPSAIDSRGPLAQLVPATGHGHGGGIKCVDQNGDGQAIVLSRQVLKSAANIADVGGTHNNEIEAATRGSTTVLVAGHDLKFAQGIIQHLQAQGFVVLLDQWKGHSEHDEEQSMRLLAEADVIFCEWTLGNAVWYSKNKLPGQRLVTRLHLQEISTKYLKEVEQSQVDQYVFVGQHIADIAQRDFGIPASKSCVVPNYVPVTRLKQPKTEEARWNLGIVGTVPERKRLDLALDALRLLRQQDRRYKLYVKGKKADEYPWMKHRPQEAAFYDEQDRRVKTDPLLVGAVFFEGHGEDMDAWYRKIGTVLSVSDFESFHLTLADGAASGAVPVALAWDGADQIYPFEWLHASLSDLVRSVLTTTADEGVWQRAGESAAMYAKTSFDETHVLPKLGALITGSAVLPVQQS